MSSELATSGVPELSWMSAQFETWQSLVARVDARRWSEVLYRVEYPVYELSHRAEAALRATSDLSADWAELRSKTFTII